MAVLEEGQEATVGPNTSDTSWSGIWYNELWDLEQGTVE